MEVPVFNFYTPDKILAPILVSSPHSGRFYPEKLFNASSLSKLELRGSEDAFVDKICNNISQKGVCFIKGEIARSYLDLNRDPNILDSLIIESAVNTACPITDGGFGIIPRLVGVGQKIYNNKLSMQDALERIEAIHKPYHMQIRQQLDAFKKGFGRAILLDIHSMPNVSLGNIKADIVIGDRFGKSCKQDIIDFIETHFNECGLKTRRNHPFAGGFTTKTYGDPLDGIDAVQIEINRSFYMNESNLALNSGFETISNVITTLIEKAVVEFGN